MSTEKLTLSGAINAGLAQERAAFVAYESSFVPSSEGAR